MPGDASALSARGEWEYGGADAKIGVVGLVQSNLAILFKRYYPDRNVVASVNMKRRGTELALERLPEAFD